MQSPTFAAIAVLKLHGWIKLLLDWNQTYSPYEMRQVVTTSWDMTTDRNESVADFNIIDNGGRRKNGDRRTFNYTVHIPERRCGEDRRTGKDRRQHSRYLGGQ